MTPRPTAPERDWRVPRHVAACDQKAWSLKLRHLDTGKRKAVCYWCGSWRHPGRCAKWRLAQDFESIKYGLEHLFETYGAVAYIVLTHKPEADQAKYQAFRSGGEKWERLRPRLNYRLGKTVSAQTWEQTRRGWPHTNIVLTFGEIRKICQVGGCEHAERVDCSNKNPWCKNCGGHGFKVRLCAGWRRLRKLIGEHARASGFGCRIWLEPVHTVGAMASYLNKLILEVNESGKKDQLPTNAPPKFRRVRFTQDWPRPSKERKPKEWTGELVQKPVKEVEADIAREDERNRRHGDGTAMPAPPGRHEWWHIAKITRQLLERAGAQESDIHAELQRRKREFNRTKNGRDRGRK